MAHNSYTHAPAGGWATGYVPTQADFADLDLKTYQAINGDLGGTWAPSSLITIGGSGLSVTGAATFSGTAMFSGDTTVNATALFLGTTSFQHDTSWSGLAPCTFSGGVTFNTTAVTFSVSSNVTVASVSTFTGAVNITNALTVSGFVTASNGCSFTGSTVTVAAGTNLVLSPDNGSLTTPIVCSGTGRVRKRLILGADANTAYTIANGDMIIVNGLTADRTYVLSNTGSAIGDTIEISRLQIGGTPDARVLTVQNSAAQVLLTMASNTAGVYCDAKFVHNGSNYVLFSVGKF